MNNLLNQRCGSGEASTNGEGHVLRTWCAAPKLPAGRRTNNAAVTRGPLCAAPKALIFGGWQVRPGSAAKARQEWET